MTAGPPHPAEAPASDSPYPRVLPTHTGAPMSVVVNAMAPAAFDRLWGMTLLERTLRLVERLGASQVHVLAPPWDVKRARRRRFPAAAAVQVHGVDDAPEALVRDLVERAPGPVLLLDGEVVYDRRLVAALWPCPPPAALCPSGGGAPVLLADAAPAPLLEGPWRGWAASWCASASVCRLDPAQVQGLLTLLRRQVEPRNLRVVDATSRQRAEAHLRDMAGKGVNDLLAEFVHPPVEFFLTRLVARTTITPNQVSYFNTVLSLVSLPLFASGHLWLGIACSLVRGVSDGVDGKLARLTLRESRGGDRIDHVVDRVYLPAFFLSLGWHLGGGDPGAPAMQLAYLLVGLYVVNRLLASTFARRVGTSSGAHRRIDRLVRRIWPKRNICVLLLLLATLWGAPLRGVQGMAALSGFMVLYRGLRLAWEARGQRAAPWSPHSFPVQDHSKPGCARRPTRSGHRQRHP